MVNFPESEKKQRSWLEKTASPYSLYSEAAFRRWQKLDPVLEKYVFVNGNQDFSLETFQSASKVFWPEVQPPTADARIIALGNVLLPTVAAPKQAPPPAWKDCTLCQRFQEFYQRDQWVGMIYGMEAGEEKAIYPLLYQLARQRQGILILAPNNANQYEPIYRELLSYRLPITRDNRLMTSFVPKNSRIYYVEDQTIAGSLLTCVDFIVFGGCFEKGNIFYQPRLPLLSSAPLFALTPCKNPWLAALSQKHWLQQAHSIDALAEAITASWQRKADHFQERHAWLDWQSQSRSRFQDFVKLSRRC